MQHKRLAEAMKELKTAVQLFSSSRYPTTRHELKSISQLEQSADNPYRRYFANQECGFISNPQDIENCTAIIVGLTGLGGLMAETLCRCGIGRLILFDNSNVLSSDMGRMFYSPDAIGFPKSSQARQRLQSINPDVELQIAAQLQDLEGLIQTPLHKRVVDRNGVKLIGILSSVDETTTKAMYQLSLDQNMPLIHVQLSSDAFKGRIQLVPPCTTCHVSKPDVDFDPAPLPPHDINVPILPSTETILAGLGSHQVFKQILGFGTMPRSIVYNGLDDTVDTTTTQCECVSRGGKI